MAAPWVTDEDYERLRGFFACFARLGLGLDNALAPLENLERTVPKRAAFGLRQAIQDCLELSADFPPAKVRHIDEALSAQGLPTLSELRISHWRRARLALSRGAIRTASEHSAIRALATCGPQAIQQRCVTMLEAFELRPLRRRFGSKPRRPTEEAEAFEDAKE